MVMNINVSEVFDVGTVTATLRRVTKQSVDFVISETHVDTTINVIVQVADTEKLIKNNLDHTLEYITVHTMSSCNINDIILNINSTAYSNKSYRIISKRDYQAYGFFEFVGELIK